MLLFPHATLTKYTSVDEVVEFIEAIVVWVMYCKYICSFTVNNLFVEVLTAFDYVCAGSIGVYAEIVSGEGGHLGVIQGDMGVDITLRNIFREIDFSEL